LTLKYFARERADVGDIRVPDFNAGARLTAVMLAPHFSGLFARQSDFGDPAGVVLLCCLGDTIVADFPQNLTCGADRSIASRRAVWASCAS